uniref:Uncharacterized protein n=1 Tax=Cacopsylla melanoneura TaxID=428564 RepID=A0A8D9BM73_9HEMI
MSFVFLNLLITLLLYLLLFITDDNFIVDCCDIFKNIVGFFPLLLDGYLINDSVENELIVFNYYTKYEIGGNFFHRFYYFLSFLSFKTKNCVFVRKLVLYVNFKFTAVTR